MTHKTQTSDIALILRAAAFAAHKHRDQRRKGAEACPYINHPLALADVLACEAGITDAEVLCAALLHDTLEDTQTTQDELEAAFGSTIAAIVQEVSDDKHISDRKERKRLQIENAAGSSVQAKLVKLADKICNLRDIVDNPPVGWSKVRKQAYFDWAKQVVDRIRGTHQGLEALFDREFARKPK